MKINDVFAGLWSLAMMAGTKPLKIEGESKMPSIKTRHPGAAGLLAGVVFAIGLLSGGPALAVCVPDPFPEDWLIQQENLGGKTIEHYIGKTDSELLQRYNEGYPTRPSTYHTVEFAELIIQASLVENRELHDNWASAAEFREELTTVTEFGRVVLTSPFPLADDSHLMPVVKILTVIVMGLEDKCFLLKSYPVP